MSLAIGSTPYMSVLLYLAHCFTCSAEFRTQRQPLAAYKYAFEVLRCIHVIERASVYNPSSRRRLSLTCREHGIRSLAGFASAVPFARRERQFPSGGRLRRGARNRGLLMPRMALRALRYTVAAAWTRRGKLFFAVKYDLLLIWK